MFGQPDVVIAERFGLDTQVEMVAIERRLRLAGKFRIAKRPQLAELECHGLSPLIQSES